jgi:hypothetical protein
MIIPLRRYHVAMLLLVSTLSTDAAHGQASGFVAQVLPASNAARYGNLVNWFERTRYLDNMAAGLNARFQLPSVVAVGAAECGRTNAFYNAQHRAILICYELVDDIIREFRHDGLTDTQRDQAIVGAMSFILYHEVGHALIDVYDLPITGREEDVADQVATYILSESDPMSAFWAAQYWIQSGDPGDTGLFKGFFRSRIQFADEHSVDEQRFFNVLCWTYGADPRGRAYLLGALPAARAQRCPSEYRRMSLAFNTLLSSHTRTTAIADASVPPPPRPSAALGESGGTLSGAWSFIEKLASSDGSISCDDNGTLRFVGDGPSYQGSYSQQGTCRVSGKVVDNPGSGNFTAQVAGGVLSFREENCLYTAAIGIGVTRIEGTVTCEVNGSAGPLHVNGTWMAERIQ